MKFFRTLGLLTLLGGAFASPQRGGGACTAAKRKRILAGVPPGFNDQAPGATAEFLQTLPLEPTATLTLFIDGAPGLQVAPDATTVRNFALLVRQIFYKVVPGTPKTVDFGNGSTRSELEITTGAAHVIALPANFHAGLIFDYNLDTCMIEDVVGILTIPTSVLGRPVSMPAIMQEFQDMADKAATMAPCCDP